MLVLISMGGMVEKITLRKEDLETINKIVIENNLTYFSLTKCNGSGIGYTLTLKFDSSINGRDAIISIPVCDEESW